MFKKTNFYRILLNNHPFFSRLPSVFLFVLTPGAGTSANCWGTVESRVVTVASYVRWTSAKVCRERLVIRSQLKTNRSVCKQGKMFHTFDRACLILYQKLINTDRYKANVFYVFTFPNLVHVCLPAPWIGVSKITEELWKLFSFIVVEYDTCQVKLSSLKYQWYWDMAGCWI